MSYKGTDILKQILCLFVAGVIATLITLILLKTISAPFNAGAEIAKDVDKGIVTQCIEENIGLFSTVSEYRIYISIPYTYKNKEREIFKYYAVTEDVWNKYAVGDIFDASKEKYLDTGLSS